MQRLTALSLEAIAVLDGGQIALAFAQELARVAADISDRPGDKAERNVALTIAVKPLLASDGTCEDVNLQMAVVSKLPKRKTQVYSMVLGKKSFLFNRDSLDCVAQGTLFDDQDDDDPSEGRG